LEVRKSIDRAKGRAVKKEKERGGKEKKTLTQKKANRKTKKKKKKRKKKEVGCRLYTRFHEEGRRGKREKKTAKVA